MKIYSGLNTGYSSLDTPQVSGNIQTPVKDLTGRITSYSTNGTGLPTTPTTAPIKSSRVKPQLNSTGQYIDTTTGLPYHGSYVDDSGRSQYFSNGQQVNNAADVGIQKQDFSVSRTAKNPTITGAIDSLQSGAAANTGLMSKSFNDYLNQSNQVNADAKTQLAKDQAAYDPSQTINRLNTDSASQADALLANNRNYESGQNKILNDVGNTTRSYTGNLTDFLGGLEKNTALTADQLRQNNADYAANQNSVQGDVAGHNKTYSTTVADRLNKLQSDFTAQNAQYESASQAVADRAYSAAQKSNDLYQLTTGTPTSASGALDNRRMTAYANINVPLQQQLADRRYQQVNQLDAAHAAADQSNYGNLMQQYAGRSALNSDLANRGVSLDQYLQGLYGQNYGAETSTASALNNANLNLSQLGAGLNTDIANRNADTAKYLATTDANTAAQIQSLRTQTAGMSRAAAAQYLQQLAVPAQIAQQILGSDVANQSAIQGLDERANAYTFNTPYDTSRVPASPGFSAVAPRSYMPVAGNTATSGASPAPRNYTDTATSGQTGSTAQNGWIQGSDGNYYVPDATAPNGYRLVWQKPNVNTGAYPSGNTYQRNGAKYNINEPASGSGVTDYGIYQ